MATKTKTETPPPLEIDWRFEADRLREAMSEAEELIRYNTQGTAPKAWKILVTALAPRPLKSK